MSRPQAKSNVALLTEGAAYIQRAKKARREQVDEIKFNDDARREWLTGFSKRKKAKIEDRRARAKERDRLAHVEERRKARQDLKKRAADNAKEVRRALGLPVEEEEDDDEEEEEAGPSQPVQTEYSDDDQLATVTITEDFDLDAPPLRPALNSDDEPASSVPLLPASSRRAEQRAKRQKEEAAALKLKKKEAKKAVQEEKEKRSRSMETKSERRKGREMEMVRRSKKASMAMDRDGRSRGVSARGGKGARGGRGGKGGKRGGKR